MFLYSWLSDWRRKTIETIGLGQRVRRSRRHSPVLHSNPEQLEQRNLLTTIDLANLGAGGITISGVDAGDRSGASVSNAGDVNGDGFDDFLIAAPRAYGAGNLLPEAGETYLIFGGPSMPAALDPANLGTAGITIFGADQFDISGQSISSAGDVNGDGFNDILIGAPGGDGINNTLPGAGDSYVVFGGNSLPATINLANLGTAGITIYGILENDASGYSVSSAGDFNGDGFDDLLIGAFDRPGTGIGQYHVGESYVIFGGASLPTTISLANPGSVGVKIQGIDAYDNSGRSVSSAGDVNGDGFDDIIIGAYNGDGAGNAVTNSGESYIIFGRATPLPTINLANLGSSGVTIFGIDPLDRSGFSVSDAGDVNGDGFDDVLIGAELGDGAGNAHNTSGESYLIFGGPSL
ncbi:MAG: hypothetical protein JWM11_7399, partial [Planctomycetaceae bacterium]|nr:hypothetical protein [Planctomycetaceae bacterium]